MQRPRSTRVLPPTNLTRPSAASRGVSEKIFAGRLGLRASIYGSTEWPQLG